MPLQTKLGKTLLISRCSSRMIECWKLCFRAKR